VLAWVTVAALHKVTTNDMWIQIRSGGDILRTRHVPTVETYSAVAAGRPLINQEWLSGVVWYLAAQQFDGALLSVINAAVALAVAILLLRSVSRRVDPASPAVIIALFLCMYLVLYRMVLRPHIFTILMQAVLVLLVERWKIDGRAKRFLWLMPL